MYARLYKQPNTMKEVAVQADPANIPDVYCHDHCLCNEDDVMFVEVAETTEFVDSQLWRCEVLMKEATLMIFSVQVSPGDADSELADNLESA